MGRGPDLKPRIRRPKPLPEGHDEHWTPENLAWLAGLLEGEGSFHISRKKDRPWQFHISLQMTDRDVVERARVIAGVGGAVTRGDRAKHYPNKGWKDIWHFRVQATNETRALAEAILPLMGERRSEAIADGLALLDRRSAERAQSSQ